MTATLSPNIVVDEVNPHHDRRWWILGVLALAQLMVVLDATIVTIALPSAQKSLGFTDSNRQWIVTAYALAFGSLLLLGGRLAGLIGRKHAFLIGLAGFAVASAVGGAATSFGMLVASRAVQGVFGALLAPAALSMLTTIFTEPRERGRAFGIYGGIAGGGSAVGLLLGGVLTEYLSWRWCMYVNLVFAGVALVGGVRLLHRDVINTKSRLDMPGILSVSAALFSLVYGFSHAETAGWGDSQTMAWLGAGVILLIVFGVLQTRVRNPLLPLRILADRNRTGAYLAVLTAGAGIFGVFLFLTYYLQNSRGYSSVMTGVAFLPMSATVVVVAATSSSLLARRVGPRFLIVPGMLMAALGMVLLTRISLSSSYLWPILPAMLLLGAGLGLVFSAAISNATYGVLEEDAGVASALVNTGQQIGGSIGTSLLSTLAASAVTSYVSAHRGNAGSVLARAQVHGYTTAFWWAAAIFVIGALGCSLLLNTKAVAGSPRSELVMH